MYLFFDTETTGLPKRWDAPVSKVDNWPRLVQLAWSLHEENGDLVEEGDLIVRPEGFTIPKSSTQIHGISQKQAMEEGSELKSVLERFAEAVEKATLVIGHNVSFDESVVGAEYIRTGVPHQLWHRERMCTKLETTDYCAIPGKYGYKWPTLEELHLKVFGKGIEGAHNAMVDVQATANCFFELRKIGVV
ncbi:MAG: 3'-5' exonuclease [Bacteroidota bacterium]